jgi:hypothetical protein
LGVRPGKESPEINVSRTQRRKWVLEKIIVALMIIILFDMVVLDICKLDGKGCGIESRWPICQKAL